MPLSSQPSQPRTIDEEGTGGNRTEADAGGSGNGGELDLE